MSPPSARFDAEGDVTTRRAAAILEPYVSEIYAAFLDAGLERLTPIEITVTHRARAGERNFAAASLDGDLILLSPELIELPTATAKGIIAHEFGHAADFCYPAQWARDRGGRMRLLDVSRKGAGASDAFPIEWLRDWRARGRDEEERAADAIAETVLGIRIGYAGPCMLQTVGRGVRPRPQGLR